VLTVEGPRVAVRSVLKSEGRYRVELTNGMVYTEETGGVRAVSRSMVQMDSGEVYPMMHIVERAEDSKPAKPLEAVPPRQVVVQAEPERPEIVQAPVKVEAAQVVNVARPGAGMKPVSIRQPVLLR